VIGVGGIDDLANPRGNEALQVSVLAHPLIGEELAQVVPSRVRQQHHDDVVSLGVDGDLNGGVER